MKRLIFPLAFLACLASQSPVLPADPPRTEKPDHCCQADAVYAQELLKILQETHSVDAFVVTLDLLLDMDLDARKTIPVVIRNAERLGIFGDSLQDDDEDQVQDKAIAMVTEAINQLQDRIRPNRAKDVVPKTGERAKCPYAQPSKPAACCPAPPVTGGWAPTPLCPCAPCCPDANIIYRTPTMAPERLGTSCPNANMLYRTPIMPPVREGATAECEDHPTEAEVLKCLPKLPPASCGVKIGREDVKILIERLVDQMEPARYYPLVGPAQLHRSHWKCTVYCTETIETNCPFHFCIQQPRVEVVYIDKDHLHVGAMSEGAKPADCHEGQCPCLKFGCPNCSHALPVFPPLGEDSKPTGDVPEYRPGFIDELLPMSKGSPSPCDGPPSDAEVMQALPQFWDLHWGNYTAANQELPYAQIAKKKVLDQIDPVRFYPLIGLAQLHHCRWKCTYYYTYDCGGAPGDFATTFPVPEQLAIVVYIEKDHLHLATTFETVTER